MFKNSTVLTQSGITRMRRDNVASVLIIQGIFSGVYLPASTAMETHPPQPLCKNSPRLSTDGRIFFKIPADSRETANHPGKFFDVNFFFRLLSTIPVLS